MLKRIFQLFVIFISINCFQLVKAQKSIEQQPKAMREFRAAWIASVANINWPSKPGLSSTEQQKEAIVLLDLLQSLNFNAAILQIRPQADALYKSDLEPWSYFLTGEQGKAPNPYYDPLEFWVEAAHDRGLELHVWLNPYRAHHLSGSEESAGSVVKSKPELVLKLKDGQYWMDPSLKGVQDQSAAVVRDIVKRYDIDGVHFDDYFYPYDSYNGGEDFPDSLSWAAYQQSGGKLTRADWRRESVNTFIERIYKEIKAEKKHVKFGLSPFGIWRPGYPASVEGYDQYEKLYADAKLWLNKGWIDYFTPQLYWKVNDIPHSFPVLLGWWQSENIKNRHLWPGMNVGLGGDDKNTDEIINQIMVTRGMLPQSPGAVHWSIAALVKHPLLRSALKSGPYRNQALVPSSEWLDRKAPEKPIITVVPKGKLLEVRWNHPEKNDVFKWVVYFKYGNKWNYKIMNRKDDSLDLLASVEGSSKGISQTLISSFAVTAIDRTGNESEFVEHQIGGVN
ncbi:glycoside hydrolase family 10 protein [Pedobacter frigiditerrae]|uniref:glycoside hydrolase family 10 protein n=1 Tax=Pedobacter frigiditerrae TaxID=2530452 RepID=UPI00292FD2E8|nr:family 10 glycosylhydrolase [Pedobacter frigiditerrae]